MALWEHFPYTNFHELNMNWIIAQLKRNTDLIDHIYNQDQDVMLIGRLSSDHGVWSCSISHADINAFRAADKPVYLWVESGNLLTGSEEPVIRLTREADASYSAYTAPVLDSDNSKIIQYVYSIASDNSVTRTTVELSV